LSPSPADVSMRHRRGHVRIALGRLWVEWLEPADTRSGHPTLVFLHEALGNAALWRDFPARLCGLTGCPGLVYDRFGFGDSDPALGARGADYLARDAADLATLLDTLGLARCIPVGHSDGGTIALQLAAARPDLAVAVVTEAAHVFVEEQTLVGIRAAVSAYDNGELRRRLERHHGLRTDALFHAWADTWQAPWYRDWDITARLGTVRCPVLALQGSDDDYGTPAQLAAIAGAVSGPVAAQLLPGVGHSPHREAAEAVLARMAAFISRAADQADSHTGS
jgi:pimeloyl-ACP methyl ester carboxylesterase